MFGVLRFVGWYIALTVVASFVMLVVAFPHHPRTLTGWVWFFVLALPVTLVGDLIGEAIFRNRIAQRIEEQTAGRSVSWLRIGYGLIAMLLVFGTVWGLALWFGVDGIGNATP